jgi:hypothetical protein
MLMFVGGHGDMLMKCSGWLRIDSAESDASGGVSPPV